MNIPKGQCCDCKDDEGYKCFEPAVSCVGDNWHCVEHYGWAMSEFLKGKKDETVNSNRPERIE